MTPEAGACLLECCVSPVEDRSILNWIMLSFEWMSGQAQGRKYFNYVNISLHKQNVNIVSVSSGTFLSVNVNLSFLC